MSAKSWSCSALPAAPGLPPVLALGLALVLAAMGAGGPAGAQQGFAGRVWVEGCFDEAEGSGCLLAHPGGRYLVWDDGGTDLALRDRLRMTDIGTALWVEGDLAAAAPGVQGAARLLSVQELPDDPLAPLIGALQGEWREAATAQRGLVIKGAEWREIDTQDGGSLFLAGFGAGCAGAAEGAQPLRLRLVPLDEFDERAPACLEAEPQGDRLRLTDLASGAVRVLQRPGPELFEGAARFLGCDGEGTPVYCYLQAGPRSLALSQDMTPPELWSQIDALGPLAPVQIRGQISNPSDHAADLTLQAMAPGAAGPADALLAALQGVWQDAQAAAAEGGISVDVAGLDWLQSAGEEALWGAAVEVRADCDDPAEGAGAIRLQPYDPAEAAVCWRVLDWSADRITLSREAAGTASLTLIRVPAAAP